MKSILTAAAFAATLTAGAYFGVESQPQAEQPKLAFSPNDLTKFNVIKANNKLNVSANTSNQNFGKLFADATGTGALFASWSISVNGDQTVSFQNDRLFTVGGIISSEKFWWKDMTATRNKVGKWEKFVPSQNADGTFSFKSVQTGRLVSSENGKKPMRARTPVNKNGAWEKFELLTIN